MRICKRCKSEEALKGSLNCEKCNERNTRVSNELSSDKKLITSALVNKNNDSLPAEVFDFIKHISISDERLYREKARSIVRKYCRKA